MTRNATPSCAIRVVTQDPVVRFGARELGRYLRRAGVRASPRFLSHQDGYPITIGLPNDTRVKPPRGLRPGDDWIFILSRARNVTLSGSTPRTVLFAVYRFLNELGFRWVRPGRRGEIVPCLRAPFPTALHISEKASFRYRGLCIEGATSYEHARDLVDWGAKHGMNGYFIQFQTGHEFFRRWTRHESNPHWKGQALSLKQAGDLSDRLAAEVRKRGMELGRMGHGWTCAALELPGEGWTPEKVKVDRTRRAWLAEVDGKRRFFGDIPLNTNLCYSKPAVRQAMADACLAYARRHPEVDFLRFWLADGFNNSCACRSCRRKRPADWLIDVLNEIDAVLTEAGIPIRIAFPVYADHLWPPTRGRIRNPERFALMFAPITRSYRTSYRSADPDRGTVRPYRQNANTMPTRVDDNLAYLRAWQKRYPGDAFIFDYHMWCPAYQDIPQHHLARVLHDDITAYPSLGLAGLDNCGNQRISFPHNLLLDVTAATLWNRRASFRAIERESFEHAYGSDAMVARRFFDQLSRLWAPFTEPVHIPKPDSARIRKGLQNIPRIAQACGDFEPVITRNLQRTEGAVRWSWRYARAFVQWMDSLLPAFESYLRLNPDVEKRFEAAFEFIRRKERMLHPALDVHGAIKVLRWRIHEATREAKGN